MTDIIDLEQYVIIALKMVYEKDYYLICYPAMKRYTKQHVGERAIVFRFAHYLQNLLDKDAGFKSLDLDCEYNRNGEEPKKLHPFDNGTYPDVILHKRGSNDKNTLVAEFKGYWNNHQERDIDKLCEFTKRNEYNFDLGIAVLLGKELYKTKITIIQDGSIVREYSIGGLA